MGAEASSSRGDRCPEDTQTCPPDAKNLQSLAQCYTSCLHADEAKRNDMCPVGFQQQRGRPLCHASTACVTDKTAIAEGRTVAQYCERLPK